MALVTFLNKLQGGDSESPNGCVSSFSHGALLQLQNVFRRHSTSYQVK
jgi:hypothetical protein